MAKSGDTRNFALLLYTHTESYSIEDVLDENLLKGIFNEYAYCVHDLDVLADGVVKKEHIHLVGRCDNATTTDSIAKKLGVPKNFVQNCHNFRSAIRYLVHADDISKYQYDIADVVSNFDFKRFLKDQEVVSKARVIYQFISDNKGITLESLVGYCISNNLYAEFRRGYSIYRDLIKESRGQKL